MFKNPIEEIDIGEFKVLFVDIPASIGAAAPTAAQVSRLASPDSSPLGQLKTEEGFVSEVWRRVDPKEELEVWKRAVDLAATLREKASE
jgi:hypothetical protein